MGLRLGLVALLFTVGLFAEGQKEQLQKEQTREAPSQSGEAAQTKEFMIAAANPHAVQAGYNILKQGGSAVDAMISTQLVLNLTEPQSSGIGGGAFLLYWDAAKQELSSLDGREKAPAAADPSYFLKEDGTPKGFWESVVGGRSVGVPGTVALLELAHQRHGKLSWSELFQPAIRLAEQGFKISPRLAASIAAAAGEPRHLDLYPVTKAYFFEADGSPKKEGTVLKNPAFAASLKAIAKNGAKAFYEGDLAKKIVEAVTATTDNPGVMTLRDLAAYRALERPVVCQPYRSFNVCSMGPPSSGGIAVGQMLGLLEHFNMAEIGPGVDSAHLIAEVGRLAFADRNQYVADSDFLSVPTAGLLDKNYLTMRAQLIDMDRSMGTAKPGNPPWKEVLLRSPDTDPERPGTSHIVIVDKEGNALSMTTTIESGFGSRVMVGGFLLNNELTDFSRQPERNGRPIANRVESEKRPRSSMSPTIILHEGEPMILVGSPGGSRIIGYVAQAIVAMIDWKLSPQQAISLGHVVNRNGVTNLEEGTEVASWEADLVARGHEVEVLEMTSGLHAILYTKDGYLGGADPRREGIVMGD